MEQSERYQLIQMVNYSMLLIARCFLIPATLQFVVITRYTPHCALPEIKINALQTPFD
jgi:hypothetical protein